MHLVSFNTLTAAAAAAAPVMQDDSSKAFDHEAVVQAYHTRTGGTAAAPLPSLVYGKATGAKGMRAHIPHAEQGWPGMPGQLRADS